MQESVLYPGCRSPLARDRLTKMLNRAANTNAPSYCRRPQPYTLNNHLFCPRAGFARDVQSKFIPMAHGRSALPMCSMTVLISTGSVLISAEASPGKLEVKQAGNVTESVR